MREPGFTPRNDRRPVDLAALVHRDAGPPLSVLVTDLTDEGCRLSGEETLRIGEEIRVEIPHVGYLNAQVRWALDGEAGARFCGDRPV
ncbi:MAG TPA: PilZ domain-containing protein [Sphingomicrobium sp.]|nr:PilZ domain-containing protein [Sphingomicrobium sp.]